MDAEKKGMDGIETPNKADGGARTSGWVRNKSVRVSLVEQQLAMEECCKKHGYVIVEYYDEEGPETSK